MAAMTVPTAGSMPSDEEPTHDALDAGADNTNAVRTPVY
jgi:hypothetical protein